MTIARPGVHLTTAAASSGGLPGGPVTRDGAREEAHRELSRSIYRDDERGWFSRTIDWINDRLADLWHWLTPDPDSGLGGFQGLGVLALVIALVALVVVLRVWLGPVRRSARLQLDEATSPGPLTAAQLRALSRTQAEQGDHAEAVRSRLRAIARMLEERGVLDPRPGRTANELISDLRAVAGPSAVRPLAGETTGGGPSDPIATLAVAVEVFSEIWYGGRPANLEAYEVVVRADENLGRIRGSIGRDRAPDDAPPVRA
ncbi:hypothetical protein CcI49_33305 [Frankia sp. CcI49]|uniref:DUF4129 domain-containing protein n=1 Tax=unclassified Frankia TaxID=2632575 RepID=UPI0006CA3D1B|nr:MULTISPECIES: DUF4129 domain-containing protein [unclassified Frankia]KPM51443.1 membrane protein [Frankia sp. R43]ONH52986.1 hypothetical protein CcI49_33305 [Frankia sp. CcI49]